MHDLSNKGVVAVVDDNDSVRSALRKLLRLHEYVVYSFASPDEFLRSPDIAEIQCLVSDVRMPGMSGLELQARLIALGHSIPIIFVTAFPEAKARERALAAGANGFLTKPFDGALLIGLIEQALSDSC